MELMDAVAEVVKDYYFLSEEGRRIFKQQIIEAEELLFRTVQIIHPRKCVFKDEGICKLDPTNIIACKSCAFKKGCTEWSKRRNQLEEVHDFFYALKREIDFFEKNLLKHAEGLFERSYETSTDDSHRYHIDYSTSATNDNTIRFFDAATTVKEETVDDEKEKDEDES